ncbi:COP1-interacting protein 7-like [Typha angustifolia]|uniref:COP1-interacting protein 7-like n=1 Tax=Typha angustifolia TaxID=59011 RepID=UPI003C2F92CF
MKSDCRLDSAVFQLTPTRTRCDLVIIASSRSEKLASGLLEPFLAHLKTARDQIAKGGYSITLEPDPEIDAIWFTKGTLERFVRFVSTPEVLERVTTIESEILQIEEALAIQGNDNLGLSTVEDHQRNSAECIEGSKSTVDADAEKAIVLYKPGQLHSPTSNGTTTYKENSKVKLLRVLENRKIALQKEHGMAFARAIAAGFDRDSMAHLVSFAECFGASRLMNACLQFMELWKRKHEIGQWLEVEAPEPISSQSEFYSFNASGIVLPGDSKKQNMESSTAHVTAENTGKADQQTSSDPQHPLLAHEYFHSQYHQPGYPSWQMHPPPGPHVFQTYPMQAMPYYQNYPVGSPYFHPLYPQLDDPKFNTPPRMGLKRHSMDNKDNIVSSETSEMGVPSTRSHDDANLCASEFEKESHGCESQKQIDCSGNKSGGVVIRNLNYISPKKHDLSGNEAQSASGVDIVEDGMDMHSSSRGKKHRNTSSSSKKKEGYGNSIEYSDAHVKDEMAYQQEADTGNWQVFQNFLLRAEEKARSNEKDISASEKEPSTRRKENINGADPLLLLKRDCGSVQEQRTGGFDPMNRKASRTKQISSNDATLISDEGIGLIDSQLKEIEGGMGGYLRATSDDFMIYGHERQVAVQSSVDLSDCKYGHSNNLGNNLYSVTDDSFMVPLRSASLDQLKAVSRDTIDIESEFPSSVHRTEDSAGRRRNQRSYEPDVITLIPKRGLESGSVCYDPVKDYDNQIPVKLKAKIRENASLSIKEVKRSGIDKKQRVSQDGSEKRKDAHARKVTSSRLNPPAEAQKRAEKLRAFKADLQKVKKEKEEEQIRRLEALKIERQKRIAARRNLNATHSPSTQQKNKVRSAPKFSPSSYKGSKFSDSEPGYSSPLKKFPIRANLVGTTDSKKTTKTTRSSDSSHGLNQPVSLLSKMKNGINDVTPKAFPVSVQAKRLSNPNGDSSHRASVLKLVSSDQVRRRSMPDVSQTKKITEIMQMGKCKSASLLELRTSNSKQTTKTTTLSGSSHGLHQLDSSFTKMKKGINNGTPKPLPVPIQTKRLSDPNGSSSYRSSMSKLVSSDQVRRRSMPDASQTKKISATMQMDKSKSANLPELRSKLPKVPSSIIKNSLPNNEILQGGPASKTSQTIRSKRAIDKVPRISNSDDNLVIEKTVVMLENEVVQTLIPPPKLMDETNESHRDSRKEKSGLKLDYAAIRAPPSPVVVRAVENSANLKLVDQLNSCEVGIDYLKDKTQNFSSSVLVEKSYHAPYARATSLEDPATRNLACHESLPVLESKTAMHVESVKAQVSNSPDVDLVDQTHETYEKPQSKESKSFRKLLKFGRKSQTTASGEVSMVSDASPVDDRPMTVVSSDNAHTLKNLIAQDATDVGETPTKVSRHFSLLSPFRSKGIEKKSPA